MPRRNRSTPRISLALAGAIDPEVTCPLSRRPSPDTKVECAELVSVAADHIVVRRPEVVVEDGRAARGRRAAHRRAHDREVLGRLRPDLVDALWEPDAQPSEEDPPETR